MDVRQYYRKIREIESTLSEQYVFVMSLETADGGKAGVVSEVSREVAAKMMVEGRAVPATEEEKQAYLAQQATARRIAQKAELARRLQVAIIANPEMETATTGDKRNDSVSEK